MEFTTYRFKDCVTEIIDNRGRNPDKYYDAEKFPVIDNYLIKNELHPVVENANRFLSQSQFDNFLRGYVTEDDLLMTLVGNGIGNVSLSPNDKIAIVQNTVGFRLNQELLDSHFTFYYFKTINSAVRNLDRGASQPSVNRTDVLRLKIQVPSINTQKQIADILSTYDELIENNNKRIAILEQMAENLYKEWFVRFRFPGYENAKFENGIPSGWEIQRIGELAKIGAGGDAPQDYSPVRTSEYPIPIYSNGIANDGLYGYGKKSTKKAKSITISARGTVGFTCLRFEPYLPIVRLLSIEPDSKLLDVYYLFHNLRNENIDGYGTSQQQITIPFFKKKKVIVPPIELQTRFAHFAEDNYNQINKLKESNTNLVKQRDLLLPRLMSGKLEV